MESADMAAISKNRTFANFCRICKLILFSQKYFEIFGQIKPCFGIGNPFE